jgi:hypothetical protein
MMLVPGVQQGMDLCHQAFPDGLVVFDDHDPR